MAIQVNPTVSPRIITVPEADGDSISVQSLVNQIRQWEDDQANMPYTKLLSASGKEDLGGGASVGITAKLENTKVKFADRVSPTICTISGGNLVAVNTNSDSMSPIEPANNVSIVLAQSSSATIAVTGSGVTEQDKVDIAGKVEVLTGVAIKAKTDLLPPDPASETLVQGIKDAIGIPTSTIAGDVDTIKVEVAGIKGVGWTDETLKRLKELIETVSGGGGTNIKV